MQNFSLYIQLYFLNRDVDDIDIYVGGLSENSINGAIVGPTFSCILALQFRDLKKGDRFFYENGPSATSFTPGEKCCLSFWLNLFQFNGFQF